MNRFLTAHQLSIIRLCSAIQVDSHWKIQDRRQIKIQTIHKLSKTQKKQTTQNAATPVQSLLTILSQEIRWAYFKTPQSPHGAKDTANSLIHLCCINSSHSWLSHISSLSGAFRQLLITRRFISHLFSSLNALSSCKNSLNESRLDSQVLPSSDQVNQPTWTVTLLGTIAVLYYYSAQEKHCNWL